MNLFLPRKRHLVTAVSAVVYAVNYPIIIQVISEIQEKSCAFVEMLKIGENSLLSLLFYKILFFNTNMSYFLFLSKNVGVLVAFGLFAFCGNRF